MKAPLFICFLLSSVLVFPFALAARELHIVEHNGASNNFPVTYGIGGQNRGKRTCHREGRIYVCDIPTPPSRGTLVAPAGCRTCPIYVPRNSPCPCSIK